MMKSQAVADSIPQLVQGIRSSQAQPEELGPQLTLIMASQNFLQVSSILKQSFNIHTKNYQWIYVSFTYSAWK